MVRNADHSLTSKLSTMATEEALDSAIAAFIQRHAPDAAAAAADATMEGVDGEPATTRVAPAAPAEHTPEVHFLDGGLEVSAYNTNI